MERSEIREFLDSFHFIQATKLAAKSACRNDARRVYS